MEERENVIELSKLERQLLLYEVFIHFYGLELDTIQEVLPIERRTLQRDVKDLNDAGVVRVRFSKKEQTYKWGDTEHIPFVGDDKKPNRQKHLKKLRRLCWLIKELCNDEISSEEKYDRSNYQSCKEVYAEQFPEVSARTMQRDFKTLNRIGYPIRYNRRLRYYEFYDNYSSRRTEFGVFRKDGKLWRRLGEYDYEKQNIPWCEIENPEIFDDEDDW